MKLLTEITQKELVKNVKKELKNKRQFSFRVIGTLDEAVDFQKELEKAGYRIESRSFDGGLVDEHGDYVRYMGYQVIKC